MLHWYAAAYGDIFAKADARSVLDRWAAGVCWHGFPCRILVLSTELLRLKEVQSFPDDFDGVVSAPLSSHRETRAERRSSQVVGSPANWQTHLQAWSIHMNLNTQPSTSPHFMTEDQWQNVIAPEVLRQCDALDGVSSLCFLWVRL